MDPAKQSTLLAQLQAEVLILQAAAAATATAAALPGTVPQPIQVFVLTPVMASVGTVVDLILRSGSQYFKSATEPLTNVTFDFKDPSDLQIFLDLVLKKSQVWGWNPLFIIPVVNLATCVSVNRNLLSQYGLVPLDLVKDHVLTYYLTPTKRAQDSFMLCQCLLSSLSLEFLKVITTDSNSYHVPPIAAADGPVPAGALLLKMITTQAHVDSRATVSHIRTSLTVLDDKMIKLDSNIETFNFYVKTQLQNLLARGETSNNDLINLFKGYKAANNVEFADFIRRKEN